MKGKRVPSDWQGGLNLTYTLGNEGLENEEELEIEVHSSLEKRLFLKQKFSYFLFRTIQNVVGYIRGVEEPDRYVILGNHFDAWVYGAVSFYKNFIG